MMFLQTSALMALVASVSGHIIMGSPVPFDFEDPSTKQAPLAPAQFPCKQPSGKYAYTTMNKYKAGDSMSVQLIGGATHGGGSCQFSITTDLKPTKETQWKVLFSQIGGCPGGPTDKNLSENPDDKSNKPFSVPLPKDLPSGRYTMAWSWNNKIGNREFYMNCAPLEITGGSGDVSKVLGGLPDMFVINLPDTQCALGVGQDALYPNPGKAVATAPAAVPGLKISGSGCGTMTKMGAGAGKLGSPSKATGAPAKTSGAPALLTDSPAQATDSPAEATDSPAQATGAPADNGGVLAPSAASSAAAAQPTTAPAGNSGSSGSGSSASGCTACSTDGAVVCIGSNQYGLCSRGCAVPQPLAAGTTCSNGKISRRSVPRAYLSDVYN